MNLDLSEFEFTVDLTCEMSHPEPGRAIRYMVMGCPACHNGRTTAICGNCYVLALQHRTQTMRTGHVIMCSTCNVTCLPLQYVQFYELRHFEILSHRETERGKQ